jgi:hypothetical protein
VGSPDGVESVVRARYVIDAAGGHGPLTRSELMGRTLDDDLRNIAVYGYYRNVRPHAQLTGGEERRRTTIVTAPEGWVWVIPLKDGITSVGFVTSVAAFRAAGIVDPRQYHDAMLRSLPEFDPLFGDAELVDYRVDGRMIHTVREYSYSCKELWGPGWAAVGDASGFVDAILSIGCFVAQNHGQFLAYALASVLDGQCDEALAFESYATTAQENLRAFRAVAHIFYAFNPDMTAWWRECSERLRSSDLVPEDSDRTSFAAFFTGFAARTSLYEDALDATRSTPSVVSSWSRSARTCSAPTSPSSASAWRVISSARAKWSRAIRSCASRGPTRRAHSCCRGAVRGGWRPRCASTCSSSNRPARASRWSRGGSTCRRGPPKCPG